MKNKSLVFAGILGAVFGFLVFVIQKFMIGLTGRPIDIPHIGTWIIFILGMINGAIVCKVSSKDSED